MRLFWTQYLRQLVQFLKETTATKELFTFVTKLMVETELSNYLEIIVQPNQFIAELIQII